MFAEKLIDFSHLASGALVFGHIISGEDVSVLFIISGVVIHILGYIASYQLSTLN